MFNSNRNCNPGSSGSFIDFMVFNQVMNSGKKQDKRQGAPKRSCLESKPDETNTPDSKSK